MRVGGGGATAAGRLLEKAVARLTALSWAAHSGEESRRGARVHREVRGLRSMQRMVDVMSAEVEGSLNKRRNDALVERLRRGGQRDSD